MAKPATPPPKDAIERFAFWAACFVAPLTLGGSAAELYAIGCHAMLVWPPALPLALDVPVVVAAAQVRARRHVVLGWCVLLAGALGSASFQVLYAWWVLSVRDPLIIAAHPVLIAASLVMFELAMPDESVTEAAPAPSVNNQTRGAGTAARTRSAPAATAETPPTPASGIPANVPGEAGRKGRGRPVPVDPVPLSGGSTSSLTAADIVRLLQADGEPCTKAAVMRVTSWGSGRAVKIMDEVTALYSESNVRLLHTPSSNHGG